MRRAYLTTIAVLAASTSMLLRAQAGLETLPVQGSVYALMSSAGNSTVQIGPEGRWSSTPCRQPAASRCSPPFAPSARVRSATSS
jgi:hypothetical protein